MVLAVVASLLAIGGIVYGVVRHTRAVIIGSTGALGLIVAGWAYFWFNPY